MCLLCVLSLLSRPAIEKVKPPFEVKYTSLNLEGYTPISSKLGHMSFLWRFSSLRGLVLPPSSFPQLILPHGLNEKQAQGVKSYTFFIITM